MILLTGGTGFLGSHVLYNLFKLDKKVRVLKRKNSPFTQVEAAYEFYSSTQTGLQSFKEYVNSFEWYDGDLRDFDRLNECLNDVDEIIHIAGLVTYQARSRSDVTRINTKITRDLVNLAVDKGIRKFHYVSSIAALNRDENNIINEVITGSNDDFQSEYSRSKYLAELEVWRGYQEGLTGVIVNPGVIIGPGHPSAGSLMFFKLIANGMKFYPSGSNGYVDVRDVASCLLKLAVDEKFYDNRFLLVSETLSYKQLFTMIADGFKMKYKGISTGKTSGTILSVLDGIKSLLTGREKTITREIVRMANTKYQFDNSKIVEQLDYKFIPISQSINETCEYLEKYFNIN